MSVLSFYSIYPNTLPFESHSVPAAVCNAQPLCTRTLLSFFVRTTAWIRLVLDYLYYCLPSTTYSSGFTVYDLLYSSLRSDVKYSENVYLC